MADTGAPTPPSPEGERSMGNAAMLDTAFLYGMNASYIEQLHAKYAQNPAQLPQEWQDFFAQIDDQGSEIADAAKGPAWKRTDWPQEANGEMVSALDGNWALEDVASNELSPPAIQANIAMLDAQSVPQAVKDSIRAIMMIRAYRIRGHLAANLDPLNLSDFGDQPELDPASYGFMPEDMDRPIFIDNVLGLETATIPQMLEILRRTYCSTIGVEFMHISDPKEKAWMQQRIEGPDKTVSFTKEGKKAILKKLIEAESFERFLHKRYPGTKRFGLDGGEAAVPALEQIIKRGGAKGVKEIIIGMPHRGRLNVLAAVMGKPYHIIFHEFMGGSSQGAEGFGTGDVKYHLGASSDREFDGKNVHLSLTANPSHLEAVNPVVLGKARAKQAYIKREETGKGRHKVLPLLLHGDAAFAGQGVVSECFGLSGLSGYRTGGTIHFIVNNQIGFTTSPKYSRSSPYPSDVALMVQAPILHVNGDDPEAVTFAAKIATEYRQEFGKDVVIDMFCYRRYGHNEGDEPMFTQPIMYKKIKSHPTVFEQYKARLIDEGLIREAEVDNWSKAFDDFLDAEFEKGRDYQTNKADWLDGKWSGLGLPENDERRSNTAVSDEVLRHIGECITQIPGDMVPHRTLKRIYEARADAFHKGKGLDWASCEALAFGTLLDEGFPVRLSGQDSGRGTFSQRHSHVVDQNTEQRYTPLNHIREGQGHYEVIDSLLSEFAVLGYEYGYSLADPNTLTLWEAQFGDFANGAQVMFDQFISSGERKWLRMSGLVCLLPHGYEGQGPEHSSARLERFLQLCAEDNMQLVNLTTPANYFHALRRQIHRDFRKPLIIMTPKSLLRHKRCVSEMKDISLGSSFHRLLWDDAEMHNGLTTTKLVEDENIRRVVICSGKVYFDLLEERERRDVNDVYLLRVEQFYPFPAKSMISELERFPQAEMVWCQEEPKNMGAWSFMEANIEWVLKRIEAKHNRPVYAGRPASASTATGLMSKHIAERDAFLEQALGTELDS